MYLLSSDLEGNILFEKRYTSPTKTYETWKGVLKENSFGELVTIGYTIDTVNWKGLFIKYNTDGDTIFTKEYISPNYNSTGDPFFVARDFIETQDSGYIFIANTINSVEKDIAILRLDSLGNLIWSKTYGTLQSDSPKTILQVEENFLIGGLSWDQQDVYRNYLFKINGVGDLLWDYVSPPEEKRFSINDMLLLEDSSLVITTTVVKEEDQTGIKTNGNFYKLDKNLEIVWDTEIKEGQPNNISHFSNLIEVDNGSNYVGGGVHFVNGRKAWISKISSEGDSLWSQLYAYPNLPTSATHRIIDLRQTHDGGYLLCGETDGDSGGQRGWLLKLDEYGCLVPGCHLTDATENLSKETIQVNLYPNPTSEYLNVFISDKIKKGQGKIINLSGQVLESFQTEEENTTYIFDVSRLPSGIYFLKIQDDKGRILTKEFVVQR